MLFVRYSNLVLLSKSLKRYSSRSYSITATLAVLDPHHSQRTDLATAPRMPHRWSVFSSPPSITQGVCSVLLWFVCRIQYCCPWTSALWSRLLSLCMVQIVYRNPGSFSQRLHSPCTFRIDGVPKGSVFCQNVITMLRYCTTSLELQLGVSLDHTLSLKQHTSNICQSSLSRAQKNQITSLLSGDAVKRVLVVFVLGGFCFWSRVD